MPEIYAAVGKKSFGSKIAIKGYRSNEYHIFIEPLQSMLNNPLSRPKALIIDDETDICFLLSGILRQKNFQTTLAGSLSEAEKIIENETEHSVIFLDNHLPDGLGVNYIATLKQKCPLSIIVMITAHDTIADREKATAQGVDYFIGKPFSKEVIFKTLEGIAVKTT
jgi:two-component system OmpR family response regulator